MFPAVYYVNGRRFCSIALKEPPPELRRSLRRRQCDESTAAWQVAQTCWKAVGKLGYVQVQSRYWGLYL